MLNVKGLSELLTLNADEKLCKLWWLMTPNGTLLAYSQPSTIKDVRKKAAMISLSWQENELAKVPPADDESNEDHDSAKDMDHLRALTIETRIANILVTRLQAQVLLVLEGGVPPRRHGFEPKTTAESVDDDQYPPDDPNLSNLKLESNISSRASSTISNAASSGLRLQRKKLEAMANSIMDEFEQTGFRMPEDGTLKFF